MRSLKQITNESREIEFKMWCSQDDITLEDAGALLLDVTRAWVQQPAWQSTAPDYYWRVATPHADVLRVRDLDGRGDTAEVTLKHRDRRTNVNRMEHNSLMRGDVMKLVDSYRLLLNMEPQVVRKTHITWMFHEDSNDIGVSVCAYIIEEDAERRIFVECEALTHGAALSLRADTKNVFQDAGVELADEPRSLNEIFIA